MTMDDATLDKIILDDVHAAVDMVRGEIGPIVWLTGNAFMPPLRAWGRAEEVWKLDDDGDAFIYYAEEFERMLENHNIYVTCPEYDNALYAVDMARWAWAGEDDAEELRDEWVRRGESDLEEEEYAR